MFAILLWSFTVFLDSIAGTYYKISLDLSRLSNNLFKVFAILWNLVILVWVLIFQWSTLFHNWTLLLFLPFIISIIRFFNEQLYLEILKKEKLSVLLPYNNLDKICTVIFWFFLYAGTDKEISFITFFITLMTILVIITFSIDLKKMQFPKSFWLISLYNLIKSILYLSIAYVLISISSSEYFIIKWFWELSAIILISLILRENIKNLLQQSKRFYITRAIPSLVWWLTYILSLYIIETSWIIIATLLGFLWIAFNILAMKIIAKDCPTKKQIILAFIVIILIGTWYYFK